MLERVKMAAAAVLGAMSMIGMIGAVMVARTAQSAEETETVSFTHQILPLFEQNCVNCHNPSGVGYKSINLDLRSYRGVMAGSTLGVAVIPNHPELSPLVQVLEKNGHAFKNLEMPPIGPRLSPEQVALIGAWIRQGARDN